MLGLILGKWPFGCVGETLFMQTVFMSLSDEEVHGINKAMELEDSWAGRGDIKLASPQRLRHAHLSPLYLCVSTERKME